MVGERQAYALGRRAVADPRDLWYLLVDQAPGIFHEALPPEAHRRAARGMIYDQGKRPWAVACALLAALHASPQQIGPSRTPDPETLDRLARELEGAVGPGLTVRSGCRALKRLGIITGYAWSYDAAEIKHWLGSGRGLTLGLDWYDGMNSPDESGLIRAWGRPLGGHAVFAFAYEPERDLVWIQNSHGPDWGGWSTRTGRRDFQGCARLPLGDLTKLLADNGEAVALFKHPAWQGMKP